MYKNIFKTEVGVEALNQAGKVHSTASLNAAVAVYDALFDELNSLFGKGEKSDRERIYQILRYRSQIVRLVCLPVEDAKLDAAIERAREYLDSR
jgi:hypothetical protein